MPFYRRFIQLFKLAADLHNLYKGTKFTGRNSQIDGPLEKKSEFSTLLPLAVLGDSYF